MTYPLEFRRHIFKVQAEERLSDSETARRFHIGLSSLKRWAKNPEPVKRRNRKARIDMESLAKDVEACPDDYQYERAQRGLAYEHARDVLCAQAAGNKP